MSNDKNDDPRPTPESMRAEASVINDCLEAGKALRDARISLGNSSLIADDSERAENVKKQLNTDVFKPVLECIDSGIERLSKNKGQIR